MVFVVAGCGKKDTPPKSEESKAVKKEEVASPTAIVDPTVSPQSEPAQKYDQPTFVDVASERGIDFQFYSDTVPDRFLLVENMGGAAAWLDFDLDGAMDAYFTNGAKLEGDKGSHQNQMFRGLASGQFENVTASSGAADAAYSYGIAVGDFDLDGFPDVAVTNFGVNTLHRNNGDGTFSSEALGVDATWSVGCVWFDANDDGLPDLFVANYFDVTPESNKRCERAGEIGYCGPGDFAALSDQVLLSDGEGGFKDGTDELGFKIDRPGYSLGVVAADMNDDTKPEIFVSSDTTANNFYSQVNGRWENLAETAGVAMSGAGEAEAGMGIGCADFDADGLPDLVVTHYYEAKNTLYRNLGEMVFSDDSFRSRLAATSYQFLGFGTNVIDFNRDGQPDLFVTNGHVLGPNHPPFEMTSQVLVNKKGRFADVSSGAGEFFAKKRLGRGTAGADFDNDGDIDLLVVQLDHPVALLEDRSSFEGDWVGLDLRSSDRTAVTGGRVIVTAKDWRRVLPVTAGGSYLSVSDSRLLTSIPKGTTEVDVEVVWPGGTKTAYTGVSTNHYWTLDARSPEPRMDVR